MTYEVVVLRAAERSIRKLPAPARRRIEGTLALLADQPRPPAATKLVGRPEWRVRVGDHRVVYRIDDGQLVIVVVSAGHRRDIYR